MALLKPQAATALATLLARSAALQSCSVLSLIFVLAREITDQVAEPLRKGFFAKLFDIDKDEAELDQLSDDMATGKSARYQILELVLLLISMF